MSDDKKAAADVFRDTADLATRVRELEAENEGLHRRLDEARGASRDVPIKSMSDAEAWRFVHLALVNLGEAVRHIGDASLVRGGTASAAEVATRARLNVARAAACLDGRVWEAPRDVKG